MTDIEKVRAALQRAENICLNANLWHSRNMMKEALALLEGKIIVPIEPTDEDLDRATRESFVAGIEISLSPELRESYRQSKRRDYRAMIAPYLPKE